LQLYDLSKDIGEEHDLAAKHPEMVEQLSNLLKEAHVESDVFRLFSANSKGK